MHPGKHVTNDRLQRGEADAVAPHEGLNDRIRKHFAQRRLDPGSAPGLLLVEGARQIRPAEFSVHGHRHTLQQRSFA
jgi:hypothetical protein